MTTVYHQIEFRAPHLIEKGLDTVIEAPLVYGADLVAPSSGTVTIYDAAGTEIVSAAAVVVTDSVATYTVTAATTTSLDSSSDWRVEWTLVYSGDTYKARNQAALLNWRIRPAVSTRRLLTREPSWVHYPDGKTSWQEQIEAAWDTILNRLYQEGREPHRITSPSSLYEPMMLLSLCYIARASATYVPAGIAAFASKSKEYCDAFEASWSKITFDVDTDDDGDTDVEGEAGSPVTYLSSPGEGW